MRTKEVFERVTYVVNQSVIDGAGAGATQYGIGCRLIKNVLIMKNHG